MGINPLYPGYYPGQRPVDVRRGQGSPSEYDFRDNYEIIDNLIADYDTLGPGFPKWVADRVVDDFKQNLKVSVKGDSVAQEDLDDYDPGSLPGAFGIGINLNPADIAKDPEKWAKGTVEKWIQAGANWQDIETRFRQKTWQHVFEKDSSALNPVDQIAVSALGARIAAYSGQDYAEGNNPLQLVDTPIRAKGNQVITGTKQVVDPKTGNIKTVLQVNKGVDDQVDVMREFATSVADYEIESSFGPSREKARDTTDSKGIRAVLTELEQNGQAQKLINSDGKAMGAYLSSKAHYDLYESMTGVGKTLSDYANDNVNKALIKGGKISPDATKRTREAVEKNLDNIKKTIDNLEAQGMKKEAAYLSKYAKEFTEQTQAILKLDILDPSKVNSTSTVLGLNALKGHLDGGITGKPLTGGNALKVSIPRTLLRNASADLTRPGIRGYTVGNLVNEAAIENKKAGTKYYSQTVTGAMNFVRNTGDINRGMEVLDALANGNMMERYVWPRVKSYFQASTPGAYMGRFMERHNNFGLLVKDDESFEKSLTYKTSTLFKGKNDPVPGRFYGNWFKLDQTFRSDNALRGIKVTGTLYGGAHFKGVDQMMAVARANNWLDPKTGDINFKAFNMMLNAKSIHHFDPSSKYYQAMVKANGGKAILLPGSIKDEKFDDFLTNIRNFKLWMAKNKGRLGVNIPENDERYYWALFEALRRHGANKDTLNITKKYAGVLEKVFTKLNTLQSKLYNSVLGKIIAPAAYIKKLVADIISTVITKALNLLASAASGGALAPVMAVIEPLVRFVTQVVVNQVVEIASVMYKALIHADIDSVFKYIDKTVEKGSRIALALMGTFTLLIIMPGDNFMGMMTTTFSPVDNTLAIGVGDAYGPEFQHGQGYILEAFARKQSADGCFTFEDASGSVPSMGPLAPWPDEFISLLDSRAIPALEATSGGYMARLCEAGPIRLWWTTDDQVNGFCGYMYDLNTIVFGHNKYCWSSSTYPVEWMEHLFAHETGHIYENRVGIETLTIDGQSYALSTAQAEDSGPFNTYPDQCEGRLNRSEDFAEVIGNWVRIDAEHCWTPAEAGDCDSPHNRDTFWGMYSGHCDYADKVLTRPYEPAPTTP